MQFGGSGYKQLRPNFKSLTSNALHKTSTLNRLSGRLVVVFVCSGSGAGGTVLSSRCLCRRGETIHLGAQLNSRVLAETAKRCTCRLNAARYDRWLLQFASGVPRYGVAGCTKGLKNAVHRLRVLFEFSNKRTKDTCLLSFPRQPTPPWVGPPLLPGSCLLINARLDA